MGCMELVSDQFMPGSRSAWIAYTCSSTSASLDAGTVGNYSGTQGSSMDSLAVYEDMRNLGCTSMLTARNIVARRAISIFLLAMCED